MYLTESGMITSDMLEYAKASSLISSTPSGISTRPLLFFEHLISILISFVYKMPSIVLRYGLSSNISSASSLKFLITLITSMILNLSPLSSILDGAQAVLILYNNEASEILIALPEKSAALLIALI